MWKRAFLALLLSLLGAAWFAYLTLPWPVRLRWQNPSRTAFMEYRLAEAAARGDSLVIQHEWVPLERISRHLRRAVLVAEDARFYEHNGIDWAALREELRYRGDDDFSWTDPADLRALLDALRYYRAHRARIRGRSTLTQQLAKNLYFSPERSLSRKIAEFVVARRLERFLSKDRILELYLNVAEWGPGIFGAEAAARKYFGKSAAELTREEAAQLAATLPHPLTINPARQPGRMAWRVRMILARMGGSGPARTVPLEPPEEIRVELPEPPDFPEAAVPVPEIDSAGALSPADTAASPEEATGPPEPEPTESGPES
ncbi:MAG TPA: biosynthetic peptidoglycan transglycosylase [Longimicrobiales bacterium]